MIMSADCPATKKCSEKRPVITVVAIVCCCNGLMGFYIEKRSYHTYKSSPDK